MRYHPETCAYSAWPEVLSFLHFIHMKFIWAVLCVLSTLGPPLVFRVILWFYLRVWCMTSESHRETKTCGLSTLCQFLQDGNCIFVKTQICWIICFTVSTNDKVLAYLCLGHQMPAVMFECCSLCFVHIVSECRKRIYAYVSGSLKSNWS